MRSLRVVPHLRSSVVEEAPADQLLLHTSALDDADAAVLAGNPAVRAFTWSGLATALRDPDLELVEVAEPLWLAEWVRALRCVALVRLLRPGSGRPGRPGRPGRRVAVATYAIENLDAAERLGFPSLDARPVLGALAARGTTAAVGASLLCLDTIAFGTSGAHENYRRAFGWALRRLTHAVLPPRLDGCTVCGPDTGTGRHREPTVLFLGTPSERKGFSVLMTAWERSGAAGWGWRLVVADPRAADDAGRDVPPGVEIVVRPARETVHALLASSAVVAMPSVRRPRWREQVGLPLVEGLAHGCRVVTTTETGLADDLRDHPRAVLTAPGDPDDLADGLRRAMRPVAAVATGPDGPAGHTKRDVVAWWLAVARAGARRRGQRSSAARRFARPRLADDFTVPAPTPTTRAISASDMPL